MHLINQDDINRRVIYLNNRVRKSRLRKFTAKRF